MDAPSVAEFFKRVLAWPGSEDPGYINIHWTSPKHDRGGFGGRPVRTLVDFMSLAEWTKTHPASVKDIYFCLSTQRNFGKIYNGRATALRNKGNTTGIKCIVLDVDVKEPPKGYANVIEALQAISRFVTDANLPRPTALVHSGGGIHVYWISDRVLTIEEWTPYAGGLRALADHHGLRFDSAVTVDCVRVLRIPGTFNQKQQTPRPVRLLTLGKTDYTFETSLGHIRTAAGSVQQGSGSSGHVRQLTTWNETLLPKRAPDPILSTAAYQAEIGSTYSGELLDPRVFLRDCPFFRQTFNTGGEGQEQGLWMQVGLAMVFCQEGRKTFHALSKKHAGYSPEETDAMFDRKETERQEIGLRWPSCGTFERYGSQQCAGCAHKGHIKSPLNLTAPVAPAQTSASAFAAMADLPGGLELPKGFFVDPKTGFISTSEQINLGNGNFRDKTVALILDKVTELWYQDNGDINFTVSMDAEHTTPVVLTNEQISTLPGLVGALRKQGVNTSADGKKHLETFMTNLIKLLRRQKARSSVAYGWWYEDSVVKGWAYGGIIQTDDGRVLKSSTGDKNTRLNYLPTGTIDPWFKALRLVTDQHRPQLEAIVAASFASPLLHWTGHASGALVAYSQSGSNKSTAVNVGGAVWGHPMKTKEVATSSSTAIRGKTAEINNLPIYWDDVSADADIEKAGATIKDLSQGKDGSKMYQDRSQRETGTWESLLCICSNKSMFDHYRKTNKSHAAGLYRIFEFVVPDATTTLGKVDGIDAARWQQDLQQNFGRMGERYSKMYLAQPTTMDKTVRSIQEQLTKKLGPVIPDAERFWMAIITTVLTGAHLANALDATFNLGELEQFLIATYQTMRARVADSGTVGQLSDNIETILGEFLKENSGNMLSTKDRAKQGMNRLVILGQPANTDRAIHVHWIAEDNLLRISRSKFDEFMDKHNYSPATTMAGLEKYYQARYGKDVKFNLTAGTVYNGSKEKIIEIPVPVPVNGVDMEPHWLWSEMHSHTPDKAMELIRSDQVKAGPEMPSSD